MHRSPSAPTARGTFLPAVLALAFTLTAAAALAPPAAAETTDLAVLDLLPRGGLAPAADDVVVRWPVFGPEEAARVHDRLDVWSHRIEADGTLLVRLTAAQRAVLEAAGYRLQPDRAQTAQLRLAIARRAAAEPSGTAPADLAAAGKRGAGTIPGFSCYRTVEQTFSDLAALATAHPDLAQWVDLGDSWEKINGPGAGYDLPALVITNQAGTNQAVTNQVGAADKAHFILVAAMHAREYATAELATRFAEQLVTGYGDDPEITWLLDHTAIHVIPHQNPDGRKRAETGLLWRKNVDDDFCTGTDSRGVDLNRNSAFFFAGPFSSSSSQCSTIFRGPSASSEPETATLESYMGSIFDDQRGDDLMEPAPVTASGLFISLHSFGEYVLYPWEGQTGPAPNDSGITTLARKFGFHNGYLACQSGLPPASGTTVDTAYGVYGVAAYTFELGTTFFQGCTTFEQQIVPDNLPALLYAAKAARQPYSDSKGPEVLAAQLTDQGGGLFEIAVQADDSRYDSNGCGVEPVGDIASVHYSVGQPPWAGAGDGTLAAVDGGFDSPQEDASAVIDTAGLPPGRHLLYLWAFDDAGNRGVPSAVFLDVGGDPIFADGFETGDTSRWSEVMN